MEGHLPVAVSRSLLTLLITVVFAMVGVLLTVSGRFGSGAQERRFASVHHGSSGGVALGVHERRTYAERAPHRDLSGREQDEKRDDSEQVVPGSDLLVACEEEAGSPGDALVGGSGETNPAVSAPTGAEWVVPTRPRTVSRTVDVPPPRRG